MQLSIIILNYNTFELTSKCIKSIYEKTKDLNFEIILVDNASIECDPDLFVEAFPNIKLIKNPENLGFSKGNNIGVQVAVSDVILLINSDTELKNNAINICYNKIKSMNEVGVITSQLLYTDGIIQNQCHRFDKISLALLELLRLHRLMPKKRRSQILLNGYFDHLTPVFPDRIWGTFFMFKKEILYYFPQQKLSDRFFMYGEDYEWCYQLRKHTQFKIYYDPEAKVYHHIGGSNYAGLNKNKAQTIAKNRYICNVDYYGEKKTRLFNYLKKGL
jgi:GT2 family glycosyltransferase